MEGADGHGGKGGRAAPCAGVAGGPTSQSGGGLLQGNDGNGAAEGGQPAGDQRPSASAAQHVRLSPSSSSMVSRVWAPRARPSHEARTRIMSVAVRRGRELSGKKGRQSGQQFNVAREVISEAIGEAASTGSGRKGRLGLGRAAEGSSAGVASAGREALLMRPYLQSQAFDSPQVSRQRRAAAAAKQDKSAGNGSNEPEANGTAVQSDKPDDGGGPGPSGDGDDRVGEPAGCDAAPAVTSSNSSTAAGASNAQPLERGIGGSTRRRRRRGVGGMRGRSRSGSSSDGWRQIARTASRGLLEHQEWHTIRGAPMLSRGFGGLWERRDSEDSAPAARNNPSGEVVFVGAGGAVAMNAWTATGMFPTTAEDAPAPSKTLMRGRWRSSKFRVGTGAHAAQPETATPGNHHYRAGRLVSKSTEEMVEATDKETAEALARLHVDDRTHRYGISRRDAARMMLVEPEVDRLLRCGSTPSQALNIMRSRIAGNLQSHSATSRKRPVQKRKEFIEVDFEDMLGKGKKARFEHLEPEADPLHSSIVHEKRALVEADPSLLAEIQGRGGRAKRSRT